MFGPIMTRKDSPFFSGCLKNNAQKMVITFYHFREDTCSKSGFVDNFTGFKKRLGAVKADTYELYFPHHISMFSITFVVVWLQS
jgi:hypothetical protein